MSADFTDLMVATTAALVAVVAVATASAFNSDRVAKKLDAENQAFKKKIEEDAESHRRTIQALSDYYDRKTDELKAGYENHMPLGEVKQMMLFFSKELVALDPQWFEKRNIEG